MFTKKGKTFKYQNRIISQSLCAFLSVLFLIFSSENLRAEETSSSEIKATWIYTIIDWLDWKDNSKSGKFSICAIGRDKVYMYLKRMENESKNRKGRQFEIVNKTTDDDLKECKILYISDSEQEYYMNILSSVKKEKGIITISGINGFSKHGGSIEFVIRKKAHLILNMKSFKNSKVSVDEELSGWVETIS